MPPQRRKYAACMRRLCSIEHMPHIWGSCGAYLSQMSRFCVTYKPHAYRNHGAYMVSIRGLRCICRPNAPFVVHMCSIHASGLAKKLYGILMPHTCRTYASNDLHACHKYMVHALHICANEVTYVLHLWCMNTAYNATIRMNARYSSHICRMHPGRVGVFIITGAPRCALRAFARFHSQDVPERKSTTQRLEGESPWRRHGPRKRCG